MAGPILRLVRFGNAIVGGATVVVGALMVKTGFTTPEIAIIALHSLCVASFMAAWNSFNDIFDHETDAINHPERPIPSGELSLNQAKAIGRASLLVSIICLLTAMGVASYYTEYLEGWLPSIVIWFIAFLLMFHYEMIVPASFMLKHKGLMGNLAVSALVGIVIVFGATAVNGFLTPLAWTVAAVAMLVNAAREIVKDIEDEIGDTDRETLTKVVGPESARAMAQIAIICSFIPLVLPYAREWLPMQLIITQIPAMLTLVSIKPRLYRGEDHAAQRGIRSAMIFGLLGFLISVIIAN